MESKQPDQEHTEGRQATGARSGKTLFLVMLCLIVVFLAAFMVLGPLKGGGGASSARKSTSSPGQH